MTVLSIDEVFQFAIRIEENGERFYRKSAERLESEGLKNMFNFLADEETRHKEVFINMLKKIESYQSLENYPEDYFAYIRAYADRIVFSEKDLEKKLSRIEKIEDIVDFGIKKELDSILYYQELKRLVPEKYHELLEKIIDEERKHFLKLSNVLAELKNIREA